MDLRLAARQCFLLGRKEKTLLISFLLKEKTNGPLPPSQKFFFNFFIWRRTNGPPSCHEAETEVQLSCLFPTPFSNTFVPILFIPFYHRDRSKLQSLCVLPRNTAPIFWHFVNNCDCLRLPFPPRGKMEVHLFSPSKERKLIGCFFSMEEETSGVTF